MFKNYLTISLRNLSRRRGYALLNIFGLAIGITCCLIIFQYVAYEKSYDKFNTNYDRIVRILTIDKGEGVSSKLVGVTPPPLGPAIAQELPEVIAETRLQGQGRYDLSYEDKPLKCEAAFYTESSFFNVFDFKIIEGNKAGILDKPNSIAITRNP